MKNKNKNNLTSLFIPILLILIMITFSCRDVVHDPVDVTENPFLIKYGSSAYLDFINANVRFLEVLDDSRCAEDAVCVWAGKADIKLSVLAPGQNQFIVTLKINGYVKKENIMSHITIDTLGYKFTLMNLDPYPEINIKRDLSQYTALISIIKK